MRRLSTKARSRLLRVAKKRAGREQYRKKKRWAKRLDRDERLLARRIFARQHGIIYDRNLSRTQIVVPEIFSFRDNYHETAECIAALREFGLKQRHPLMIHLSPIAELEPAAALVLVAEIFRLQKLRSRGAVAGTYPKSRAVYDSMSDMGFFSLLEIEEVYGKPKPDDVGDRPIYLRYISSNRVNSEVVDRFVGVIEKHVVDMNAVARGRLVAAIIEAMNNTLDHSQPNPSPDSMAHRWWMSSSVNMANREIIILLFDQGVGIPKTIDPNIYEKLRSFITRLSARPTDGELIMAATETYRTSTAQSGRGKGFRNMKQFVDICDDGELRVLSNRGRYSYISKTDTYADEAVSIGGTVIEWRFRHDGSVDMEDE